VVWSGCWRGKARLVVASAMKLTNKGEIEIDEYPKCYFSTSDAETSDLIWRDTCP
jgi:hypothetical protein